MTIIGKMEVLLAAGISSLAGIGFAAPDLMLRKPPVEPGISYTGPTNDSHAVLGQWFQTVASSTLTYRTHEFYDNTTNTGGGSQGSRAIVGYVTNIIYYVDQNPPFWTHIASFDVMATISNDTPPVPAGSWASGTNTLAESLTTTATSSNSLLSTIMTVDFATADSYPPSIGNPPYRDSNPYIVATNYDFTAWYGRNADVIQDGAFYVPGWDFGTIPPGQSTTRIMHFVIRNFEGRTALIPPTDSRYGLLVESGTNGTDILINRSVSLKISQWISDPAIDDGSDYPVNSQDTDASNVSVFHNVAEDWESSIRITRIGWNNAAILLDSTGNNGAALQILQSCTNLIETNWVSLVTNAAPPVPQTNSWTNLNNVGSVNFYRIITP